MGFLRKINKFHYTSKFKREDIVLAAKMINNSTKTIYQGRELSADEIKQAFSNAYIESNKK